MDLGKPCLSYFCYMAIYSDTGSNLVKFNYNQNALAKELTPSKEEIDMSIYGIPEMNGMDDYDLSIEKEYDMEAKDSELYISTLNKLQQLHSEAKAKNINISNPGSDPNAQLFAKEWLTAFYENINRGKQVKQSLDNREAYTKYAMMPNVVALPLPKGEIVTNDMVNNSLLKYDDTPLKAIVSAYKTSESVYGNNELEQLEADYDKAQKAIIQWVDTQPPQFREQLTSQVVIPYLGAMRSDRIDQYKQEKFKFEQEKQKQNVALKREQLAIKQQNANTAKQNANNKNNDSDNGYDALFSDLQEGENVDALNMVKNLSFPVNQKNSQGKTELTYIKPDRVTQDNETKVITVYYKDKILHQFEPNSENYNGVLKLAYDKTTNPKEPLKYTPTKQTTKQTTKPVKPNKNAFDWMK